MLQYVVLIICTLFVGLGAFGQVVNGVVFNEYNEPVIDAKVSSTMLDAHDHTNIEGKFSLLVPKTTNDTLIIEKKGFLPQSLVISKPFNKNYTIKLVKESQFLERVIITSKADVVNQTANIDLTENTNRSSQEILRVVPGLFVAKHAGGGKSEQMFLRGFDLDHGTDISIAVDNVPVNMVSHAHGQGYTDLHFVMPELIDKVEFGKGPYNLTKGNFATAGYVNFKTKEILDRNQLSLNYGMFNSKNLSGALKVIDNDKQHMYVATSIDRRDGYFESSQRFKRSNTFIKYSNKITPTSKLIIDGSYFSSSWDASGQIPLRSINNGSITRFGAIDDTEGGNTSRLGARLGLVKYFKDQSSLTSSIYIHRYAFELYSNFTFFNRDSVNGDQIRQKEVRNTYGFNVDYVKKYSLNEVALDILAGLGGRFDNVDDSELSYSKNRTTTLANVNLGDIDETNYFAYTGIDILYKNIRFNGGVRAEELIHEYNNKLTPTYNPQSSSAFAILPKANLTYTFNKKLNTFVKWGLGFHTNDTRLVIDDSDYLEIPIASSYDVGFEYKPFKKLLLRTAYWEMQSEQEFVYVGDEGVVEASGASIRRGVDVTLAYQLKSYLFLNANVNYTRARSKDENEFIPLAAPLTSTISLKAYITDKIKAAVSTRIMADRPANEDNSIQANGYVIHDANIGYFTKSWNFQLSIDNILNTAWDETQFLTESRLQNETTSVEEIHITPGEPRFVKGKITYNF